MRGTSCYYRQSSLMPKITCPCIINGQIWEADSHHIARVNSPESRRKRPSEWG